MNQLNASELQQVFQWLNERLAQVICSLSHIIVTAVHSFHQLWTVSVFKVKKKKNSFYELFLPSQVMENNIWYIVLQHVKTVLRGKQSGKTALQENRFLGESTPFRKKTLNRRLDDILCILICSIRFAIEIFHLKFMILHYNIFAV